MIWIIISQGKEEEEEYIYIYTTKTLIFTLMDENKSHGAGFLSIVKLNFSHGHEVAFARPHSAALHEIVSCVEGFCSGGSWRRVLGDDVVGRGWLLVVGFGMDKSWIWGSFWLGLIDANQWAHASCWLGLIYS